MNKLAMYPHTFSGLPAVQVASEFEGFLSLIKDEGVKSYLEIGTARGDTFHEIVSQMPKGSKAVAVDYPENGWGLSGSQYQLRDASKDLKYKGYSVGVVFGNSRYQGVIDNVERRGPYDLILIDGDHTYEGVKADWENYGHMGKIVAFHDIANHGRPNKRGEVIEVARFWNEFKGDFRHVEFLEEGSEMGMGVLWRE